jgi:hypothetical protein
MDAHAISVLVTRDRTTPGPAPRNSLSVLVGNSGTPVSSALKSATARGSQVVTLAGFNPVTKLVKIAFFIDRGPH